MSASWVAAGVRARGLARRRLGPEGAARVARRASLGAALDDLGHTTYQHDVRPGMDLRQAQHAVTATVIWNLRVLAGWGPATGAGGPRLLSTWFEIPNVACHLATLAGRDADPPFQLGSLSTAWPRVSGARHPDEVRRALAASAWGDPGASDPAGIQMALQLAWARRVADGAPEAARWAAGYAALVMARALVAGALGALPPRARRDARHLLGEHGQGAGTLGDLGRLVAHAATWVLEGIDDPDELWRAETRWWARVEADGHVLAARAQSGDATGVGVFGLLAADGWRTRAALELAARGGGSLDEVLDAVA